MTLTRTTKTVNDTGTNRHVCHVGLQRDILNCVKVWIGFVLALWFSWDWPALARADYDLILKNGRRITVQSYREEGGMIKFQGLGGEIGIAKDQIQAIRKTGEGEKATLDLSRPEKAGAVVTRDSTVGEKPSTPRLTEQKNGAVKETIAEQREKEEKEYQEKLAEITNQLRELRDRYAAETRGNTGPEPSFFTTEEAFKGHQADLLSRLHAAGAPIGAPLTEKQKELNALRNQIIQLENQRNALIDEMKQKGFLAGSFFLE